MKDPGQGAIREEETKRCELRNTVGERWRLCHGAMTMYGTSLLGYRSKRVRCKAKCGAPARSDGDVPIVQKLPSPVGKTPPGNPAAFDRLNAIRRKAVTSKGSPQ